MHNVTIYPIAALKDNYIWTIVNRQNQCALVVDPGDASPVLKYLNQHDLVLDGILITHHHWDHVQGITDLIQNKPVPIVGYITSPCHQLTHRIEEGGSVLVNHQFPTYQMMFIPGHTLDHVAYYGNDALFCGDTLFGGGCGRLFEGSMEQLYTSLQKIAALPAKTAIYCGHEYTFNNLLFAQEVEPNNQTIQQRIEKVKALREKNFPSLPSTLLEEKKTNPFLRCEIPEIIQQAEYHAGHSLKDPVDVFAELRKWKNSF